MADEDKPKPMSIKERMAAFQKAADQPAAPPPRPAASKPTNWAWKQKQAEAAAAAATAPPPSSSQANAPAAAQEREPPPQVDERADRKAGMSAVDAQEAIKGQSLKERMAALQGKGFNAAPEPAPPVPKPSQPRVWKRPVVPQPDEEGGEAGADAPAPSLPISLQPAHASVSPSHESENPVDEEGNAVPEGEGAPSAEVAAEGGEEDDEEEKERQRRAAIAARMARLGGARAGLGAPVFGRPAAAVRSPSPSTPASQEATSPDTPAVAARIPLPSLTSSASLTTPGAEDEEPTPVTSPPIETPSSAGGAEGAKLPPLSVPKRALPPRKKSAQPQKQTSVDSESSLKLPPPATVGELETEQPTVATPGEVEKELHLDPATQAETGPTVHDTAEPIDETESETREDEEVIPEPVEVDTKAVVAQAPPPIIEHPPVKESSGYEDEDDAEEQDQGIDEDHRSLAPGLKTQLSDDTDTDQRTGAVSPATALGQNAMSLLQDDEEEADEDAVPARKASIHEAPATEPPAVPVVRPSQIPPALRSQLDEEEEPEEDNWDDEAPPVRAAPPPPPPALPSRLSEEDGGYERSETHTPLAPATLGRDEEHTPVPAALASASPNTSPNSRLHQRPLPTVPGGQAPPVPTQLPPSRQNSESQPPMSDRPARRSLPPPPPPGPRPQVPRDVDDEDDEEGVEAGADGEGAHH